MLSSYPLYYYLHVDPIGGHYGHTSMHGVKLSLNETEKEGDNVLGSVRLYVSKCSHG